MSAGDVQLEGPMHVHRAPQPKATRRTAFMAWGDGRIDNASLTCTFADNWQKLWQARTPYEAKKKGTKRKVLLD